MVLAIFGDVVVRFVCCLEHLLDLVVAPSLRPRIKIVAEKRNPTLTTFQGNRTLSFIPRNMFAYIPRKTNRFVLIKLPFPQNLTFPDPP